MALEILQKQKKSITSLTLVPSGKGAFEVSINGKNIYSKLETGEFPDLSRISAAVQEAVEAS